jgi:hypothetical protein
MSTSAPHPPSYYARRADFRVCGDFGIPGFNNLGCGKSFQPDNTVMRVCAYCADRADRIVSQIEQASSKRDSQSQYGISGGARKRSRRAFESQYAELLD